MILARLLARWSLLLQVEPINLVKPPELTYPAWAENGNDLAVPRGGPHAPSIVEHENNRTSPDRQIEMRADANGSVRTRQ
jgi:hypothetical protein